MSREIKYEKYVKAKLDAAQAQGRVAEAFGELHRVGGDVRFRRKTDGPIHVGEIYLVDARLERVKVISRKTGAKYWVESYWIVAPHERERINPQPTGN